MQKEASGFSSGIAAEERGSYSRQPLCASAAHCERTDCCQADGRQVLLQLFLRAGENSHWSCMHSEIVQVVDGAYGFEVVSV